MKAYYNINQTKQAVLFLPTFFRNSLLTAMVGAMVAPAAALQAEIVAKIESVDTDTYSQVCALQGVLNENFDYYSRRIKVENLTVDKDYILHKRVSGNFQILNSRVNEGDTYKISLRGMTGLQSPDFAVIFPVGFALSENELSHLRALIKQNKLASKTYVIKHE